MLSIFAPFCLDLKKNKIDIVYIENRKTEITCPNIFGLFQNPFSFSPKK